MKKLLLEHEKEGTQMSISAYLRRDMTRTISLTFIILILIGSFVICFNREIINKDNSTISQNNETASEKGMQSPSETKREKDTLPPVVSASDFEITVGDSIRYKSHISVSDNEDANPLIEIDNSAVDPDKPGNYTVTYTVTDHAGNATVASVILTIKGKDAHERDLFLAERSKSILDDILDAQMNDMQKAYAIYHYVINHIGYSGSSDKSDYRIAAADGLKSGTGDCFTYFAVSKLLLDAAGIQNVDVVKLRLSKDRPRHYWSLINVGTGWYHYDSTRFSTNFNLFMLTDKELKSWDNKYYRNCHRFSSEGLPERSTVSVQKMIDYSSASLKRKD